MRRVFHDERERLRPEVQRLVVQEFRCRRAKHLQGWVLRTPYGLLVVSRPVLTVAPLGGGKLRRSRQEWQWGWLDALPDVVTITCHCDKQRRVDLTPYRTMQ